MRRARMLAASASSTIIDAFLVGKALKGLKLPISGSPE
jgi:hypothetical protein